ncbi:MAG: NAD(P)-binding domain-containing protein, partial [Candidatus Omnitrophota bacterium]
MNKKLKIAVLGDGGWGTVLAILLCEKGYEVFLWSAFRDNAKSLVRHGENRKFLPGFRIPGGVNVTSDMRIACKDADLIILAIPSRFLRDVLAKNKAALKGSGAGFVSVVKGVEQGTLLRMSEVAIDVLGRVKIAVLSGPSIAP